MMSDPSLEELILRRSVPVVINSFNQYTYLRGMVERLREEGFRNLFIVDQASDHPALMQWLAQVARDEQAYVLYSPTNKGPHDFFLSGRYHWFGGAPFFYTDPDLSWRRLAGDFVTRMFDLAHRYRVFKVGSALTIPSPVEAKADLQMRSKDGGLISVAQHESQFWENEVLPGVYNAPIDTTLHLFAPQYYVPGSPLITGLRVAGQGYDLKHLPWFKDDPMPAAEYQHYLSKSRHTTWRPDFKA